MTNEPESLFQAREPGWYLCDGENGDLLHGPFEHSQTAAVVRSDMERKGDPRTLWIVDNDTLDSWEAEARVQ